MADSNENGRIIKVDFSSDDGMPEHTKKAMEMMEEIMEMFDKVKQPPIAMMYVQDREDSVCLRSNTEMEHLPFLLANALIVLIDKEMIDKRDVLTMCLGLLESIGVKTEPIPKK